MEILSVGLREGMSAMSHEDAFHVVRLNGRCRIRKRLLPMIAEPLEAGI